METVERDVTLGEALFKAATLPLKLAMLPAMASVPPEARTHFRAAAKEARAAAEAMSPRRRRTRQTFPEVTAD